MERIRKEFNIVFSGEQSPYFQVNEDKRLALPLSFFKERPAYIKQLIWFVFDRNSKIDTTFLKFYIPYNFKKPRFYEKYSLHKSITIKNWEETLVKREDSDAALAFVTVRNLLVDEVHNYFRSILKGKRNSFIGFYNDEFLMMIDSDEVILLAKNSESIRQIHLLSKKFLKDTEIISQQ